MVATVRLWDNSEKKIVQKIERKRDSTAFFFPDDQPEKNLKILTYRVQIFTGNGDLVETWKHHFWTELIDIDRDNLSSAERMRDTVSSQPKQESVIETP